MPVSPSLDSGFDQPDQSDFGDPYQPDQSDFREPYQPIYSRTSKRGKRGSTPRSRPPLSFPCPLAMYGCPSSFSSKNEWKRHVSTQHIRLGHWRCDLCLETVDADNIYRYDFNRKDLFVQHLRRMHAAPPNHTQPQEYPITEENITEHVNSCYRRLRSPPEKSSCPFCDEVFEAPLSWEIRMEHVGRHLEKQDVTIPSNVNDWKADLELEAYLERESLIHRDHTGAFHIGSGKKREVDTLTKSLDRL